MVHVRRARRAARGGGAGAATAHLRPLGKKRSEIDQEITAYEPGRLLAWRHEEERLEGNPAPKFARETRFWIRLESEGEGTSVVLESEQEPAGVLRGLVISLFGKREVAGHMESSLERLARLGAG